MWKSVGKWGGVVIVLTIYKSGDVAGYTVE